MAAGRRNRPAAARHPTLLSGSDRPPLWGARGKIHVKSTSLRKGMIIKHNDRFYRIVSMLHLTPGNLRAMVQTKLRDLDSGSMNEHRFRADEDVERAHLDTQAMEYLYQEGDLYHFMNTETYEQTHMRADELGDAIYYLVPNIMVPIEFIEGRAVGINLPVTVDLKVVETEPAMKGATAASQRKPAKTETGLIVQVPPFVKEGETIRVSTDDGSYQERA
jgi:elongation factor P